MFIGRLDELKKLNSLYNKGKNSSCIIYSIPGMGKTELVNAFIADKESIYHAFMDMSADDIGRSVELNYGKNSLYEIILDKLSSSDKKLVVVLEDLKIIITERRI